ncbi:hypothetical protein MC885_018332, partial [Smutsia gigantea]
VCAHLQKLTQARTPLHAGSPEHSALVQEKPVPIMPKIICHFQEAAILAVTPALRSQQELGPMIPHLMVAVGACLQKQLLQGANQLAMPVALLPHALELISLAGQLLLATFLLAQAGLQPCLQLGHTGAQAILAVQQNLEQCRIHRLPTVAACLPVQVAEGDAIEELL